MLQNNTLRVSVHQSYHQASLLQYFKIKVHLQHAVQLPAVPTARHMRSDERKSIEFS
jgi:hypothetical protein